LIRSGEAETLPRTLTATARGHHHICHREIALSRRPLMNDRAMFGARNRRPTESSSIALATDMYRQRRLSEPRQILVPEPDAPPL
jgi:hypothetical protein